MPPIALPNVVKQSLSILSYPAPWGHSEAGFAQHICYTSLMGQKLVQTGPWTILEIRYYKGNMGYYNF